MFFVKRKRVTGNQQHFGRKKQMLSSTGPLPHATIGEFLYPRCYSRFRRISFPIAESVLCLSVVDCLTTSILDQWAEQSPQQLVDVTQQLSRDVWNSVRHLSVSADDLWVRLGRGYELAQTSFGPSVLPEDVILLVLVAASGRCDKPVISSSLSSSCKSLTFLKNTSLLLAKMFRRQPSSFQLQLQHSNVMLGQQLNVVDAEFFSTLRYATVARDVETLIPQPADVLPSSSSKVPRKIVIHMDDIRLFLNPPAPKVVAPVKLPPPIVAPVVVRPVPMRPLAAPSSPAAARGRPHEEQRIFRPSNMVGTPTSQRSHQQQPTYDHHYHHQYHGEEPSVQSISLDETYLHVANQTVGDDGRPSQTMWEQRQAYAPY